VLAAAYLLGTMNVYRIGGAQAIAAAAYGTQSVPRVDKIAGPGSAFVTVAKQIIAADPSNTCSIDMAAGPTETLIASNTGDAEAIAADLFAQAEHDAATLPIFVTTNADLAKQVREEAKNQSAGNAVARQSLRENGAIFVVASQQEMADVVNRIAPDWVRNAGSVFVGTQTPQALGDYISGPNHTLPTAGFARQRGGLSVADFVKTISVQSASSTALRKLAPAAIELAQAEGLAAHAASLRLALAKAEQRGRA
jgi:histidinol dehydrogenase